MQIDLVVVGSHWSLSRGWMALQVVVVVVVVAEEVPYVGRTHQKAPTSYRLVLGLRYRLARECC